MELRDYVRLVRRRWTTIAAFVALGVALGFGLTAATPRVYQADVQMFVANSGQPADASALAQGAAFVQQRVQSYVSIAASPTVTSAVVSELGLDLTSDELADKISADAPLAKVLINVHVTDKDPAAAQRIANAVADRFAVVVEETETTSPEAGSPVKLSVIRPARLPSAPIKPSLTTNLVLCVLVAIALAAAVVVARELLDTTVGVEDLEDLDLPVLGRVPFEKGASGTTLALKAHPHGMRSEAYRQLRTNLTFINVDRPPRMIAVTSAMPGEGKSATAINLADALVEAGARVCLVDADLRRPTLATSLGLVETVGLTTALVGAAPLDDLLQTVGSQLLVLASGAVPPTPASCSTARTPWSSSLS